jgi:hypothetical protein
MGLDLAVSSELVLLFRLEKEEERKKASKLLVR